MDADSQTRPAEYTQGLASLEPITRVRTTVVRMPAIWAAYCCKAPSCTAELHLERSGGRCRLHLQRENWRYKTVSSRDKTFPSQHQQSNHNTRTPCLQPTHTFNPYKEIPTIPYQSTTLRPTNKSCLSHAPLHPKPALAITATLAPPPLSRSLLSASEQ